MSSRSIDNDNLEIDKQFTQDNGANAKDSRQNSCSSKDQRKCRVHSNDNLEIHKEHMRDETTSTKHSTRDLYSSKDQEQKWDHNDFLKDHSVIPGEEHSASALITSRDFWLYYIAYFCGGTIGLVYSNNLGQISQSLGYSSDVTELVAVYSACSFFGRLLSSTPDFLHQKIYYARTGWLAFSLVPTPMAMYLLVLSGSNEALTLATALIGLSSGFVFSTAVSITSELFGPHSAGVNHNVLITGIPLGSLLYGLLAALVYETNLPKTNHFTLSDGSRVSPKKDENTTENTGSADLITWVNETATLEKETQAEIWPIVWNKAGPRSATMKDFDILGQGWSLEYQRTSIQTDPQSS
nr:protein NUCLEAR FUSION DEFECTIVE 4-like [Ipomoea batatas]